MEKFVSSLKRCKKDAVLFHPGRKTKYNQLKKKLKTMLTENVFHGQNENKDKKKRLGISKEFEKIKKNGFEELVTVVDKTPKRGEKKFAKQKKEKNVLKINDNSEVVIMKPNKKQKKSAKSSSDTNVENEDILKENARDITETNIQNVLGNISLQEGTYNMLETTANNICIEEYPDDEEVTVVNMDTTSSPVVVHGKSGPAITHPILKDCGENTHVHDDDFNVEFSSVVSCFRKSINSSEVILETCKINSPVDKCIPLTQDKQSSGTKIKRVVDKSTSFRLHILPSHGVIITMKHPCEVYVQGKVNITVVKGRVKVLGFTLTTENSKKGLSMFCPQRCVCLGIASCKLQEGADTSYIKKLEDLKASYAKLLSECSTSDCVLLLKETSNILSDYLNVHFPIKLFPKVCSSLDRKFHREENILQCQFYSSDDVDTRHITIRDEWEQVISDLSLFAGGSKTVVLGGKGVGKSTFLRYLANSCLSRDGAVLWLDFDPGQAEFTVPGCMSAVLVKEPLLGPNFTHQVIPLRMVFLGEIDVSRCPSRYNSCVQHIVEYCLAQPDLKNIPWFINTMGYNIGLGVELAVSIIRFLRPTNVIHIESKRRKDNFAQPLKSCYVNSYKSMWSSISVACDLDYATYILPSVVRDIVCKAPGLKAYESRELMVLAYLSQVVSPRRCSLLSAVPYCSPLGKLMLAVCHEPVQQSHVLMAMNGSLVALCSCDTRLVWTNSDPDMAKILVQAPVAPCLGFGIVRGVDIVNKMLYLTTPLQWDALSQVNCLLMGAVSLPPSAYFAVEPGSGHVPYVSKGWEQPMGRATRRTFRRLT